MKRVVYYKTASGKEPCREGLNESDPVAQHKIYAYIVRVSQGAGSKNLRALGDGVFEIKIDYGPGYRVYFGEKGNAILILLIGGDKDSQFRDIQQAKQYWRTYVSK